MQILRALFTEDDVTFEGRRYPLERGHPASPAGAAAASADLGRAARGAAGRCPSRGATRTSWHGWADDAAEYGRSAAIIDDAAEEAGRDPGSILRASSLSIAEPWDEVSGPRTTGWPTEGSAT